MKKFSENARLSLNADVSEYALLKGRQKAFTSLFSFLWITAQIGTKTFYYSCLCPLLLRDIPVQDCPGTTGDRIPGYRNLWREPVYCYINKGTSNNTGEKGLFSLIFIKQRIPAQVWSLQGTQGDSYRLS